jgi:hypothetical protein
MFHFFASALLFDFFAFKAVAETTVWGRGGVSESEALCSYLLTG